MSSKLPITVEDFKAYFCQDTGFDFQPYPSWKKTVWDTGDWCCYENVFYKSTIDLNHTMPSDDWVVGSAVYDEASTGYSKGAVVFYDGEYYVALEDTNSLPGTQEYWEIADLDVLFPGWRPWAVPVAYKEGDKVIGMVNFRLGVYLSTIGDNYYDPANSLYTKDPVDQYAWELQENEDVDWILDSDIERAMGEAIFKFNPSLVSNPEKQKVIALYLTAFFVAYDRQMANSGINGSSSSGPVKSRTVGKMSVSYMESTLYSRHPAYEFFSRNMYGIKAFNLLLPYLRGNVLVLRGTVSPE